MTETAEPQNPANPGEPPGTAPRGDGKRRLPVRLHPPAGATTADVLERLAKRLGRDGAQGETVPLSEVLAAMDERGMGWALLLLTLPQFMPIPLVLSNVVAIPLVLVAAQMALGRRHPWLPRRLLARRVRRVRAARACARLVPPLRRAERVIRPRAGIATSWAGRRATGICCLALSLILLAPVPLTGWLPAIALLVIGIGLLERDSIAVLAGLAIGAAGVAAFAVAVAGLLHLGERAKDAVGAAGM